MKYGNFIPFTKWISTSLNMKLIQNICSEYKDDV